MGKFNMKKILAYTLLLICSFASAQNSNPKMEDIFNFDMVGVDVAYLESKIGVARITNKESKTKQYRVGDCDLTVHYEGYSVRSLSVAINDKCLFNLNNTYIYEDNVSTKDLMFGELGPVTYYADCLENCGNAYDPEIHELYKGSRAEGFREILLSTIDYDYDKKSEWLSEMKKHETEEWVQERMYNCEPNKYSNVAGSALEGTKVGRITIGYRLEESEQLGCSNSIN